MLGPVQLINILLALLHTQELEAECERQHGQESMLSGQLKRLQDDLRRVNLQLEQGRREKATLDEKIGQWAPCHTKNVELVFR